MTTEEMLKARYDGAPLLSIGQLAEIFLRSKTGIQFTLGGDNEFSRKILPCRIKIGRRVYFKTVEIAKVIDQG